jgi:hypothetical protein
MKKKTRRTNVKTRRMNVKGGRVRTNADGTYIGNGYNQTEINFLTILNIVYIGISPPPLDRLYLFPSIKAPMFNMSLIESLCRLTRDQLTQAYTTINQTINERLEDISRFAGGLNPYNAAAAGHGHWWAVLYSVYHIIRGILGGIDINIICSFQQVLIRMYEREYESKYRSILAREFLRRYSVENQQIVDTIMRLNANLAALIREITITNANLGAIDKYRQMQRYTNFIRRINDFQLEYTQLQTAAIGNIPLEHDHSGTEVSLHNIILTCMQQNLDESTIEYPAYSLLARAEVVRVAALGDISPGAMALSEPIDHSLNTPANFLRSILFEVVSRMSYNLYTAGIVDDLAVRQLSEANDLAAIILRSASS